LIRPDGQNPYAGRYDKMHLVPFGEYVPFRETLPWLKTFTPYSHDYSCTPGDQDTRLEIPRLRSGKELAGERNAANAAPAVYRFGVLICYEDTDPYLARQYNPASGRPNPVDFLVNMSNDGWFTGTEQHEQHLAIARFRAVEARRSLVRAVNMGISAIIDPDGRIVALPDNESWAKSKGMGVRAIVVETIPLDTRTSYYARFGDWVPALLWLAMLVGWIRVKRLTRSAVQ
jgi:apolipoprotein N-acyltransferase